MPALTVVTIHMPILVCMSYRHMTLFFSSWICSAHLYLYLETVLYILKGIKLPSLPMSILYSCVSVVWLLFLALQLLLCNYYWSDAMKVENNLSYSIKIFVLPPLFFIILSCVVIFWHLPSVASAYSHEMVHFPAPGTALPVDWSPPWVIRTTTTTNFRARFAKSTKVTNTSF